MLATCQDKTSDGKTSVMFERLRGIITNEDDDTQDYELTVTADEIMLRGLKNKGQRMAPEDHMFMVYGRNLDDAGLNVLKDLLKLCHKQVESAKALKKRADMTDKEIAALQEEFFN